MGSTIRNQTLIIYSLQTKKLTVLKNKIEVAQFQSNAPRYLPLSEDFWRALGRLPLVYDYTAYRKVLERFGTHYVSEGTLGGSFEAFASFDQQTEKYSSKDSLIITTTVNLEAAEKQHFVPQYYSDLFTSFCYFIMFYMLMVNIYCQYCQCSLSIQHRLPYQGVSAIFILICKGLFKEFIMMNMIAWFHQEQIKSEINLHGCVSWCTKNMKRTNEVWPL